MPQGETYRRTLEQAVAIAGGELNLSVRLRVPPDRLKNWLSGREPVPDHAFLEAVDVITAAKLRTQSPFIDTKKPPTD